MTGCGITCGACPLAGLCGDPIPEPEQLALFVLPVDPDAPDVDPNEPKPEGVGCCGGTCAA